jgi:hypothetical protein
MTYIQFFVKTTTMSLNGTILIAQDTLHIYDEPFIYHAIYHHHNGYIQSFVLDADIVIVPLLNIAYIIPLLQSASTTATDAEIDSYLRTQVSLCIAYNQSQPTNTRTSQYWSKIQYVVELGFASQPTHNVSLVASLAWIGKQHH